ncbi:hypothetical protein ACVWZ4_007373 [Bradyrhizobium sp. USDA 4472]
MHYPLDHGLPLVQLKERRREMVVSLQNRIDLVDGVELRLLAELQQAIVAIESVIADLDCEQEVVFAADHQVRAILPFGRRAAVHSPI